MRMIICGMGEVGRHLAAELAQAGHDVVAIDTSREALAEVEELMDVLTLRGHAGLPDTLLKAGAAKAELVAAVTNHDEVNLVVALAARQLGAKVTVARLSNHDYFPDRTGWLEGMLDVDLSLCPGLLAGAEVVRLSRTGTVDHVEHFAGHLVQVMVVTIEEGMPAVNRAATSFSWGMAAGSSPSCVTVPPSHRRRSFTCSLTTRSSWPARPWSSTRWTSSSRAAGDGAAAPSSLAEGDWGATCPQSSSRPWTWSPSPTATRRPAASSQRSWTTWISSMAQGPAVRSLRI